VLESMLGFCEDNICIRMMFFFLKKKFIRYIRWTKGQYWMWNIDSNCKLPTTIYDKHNDFNFPIVHFPFLCSNIPLRLTYTDEVWTANALNRKITKCFYTGSLNWTVDCQVIHGRQHCIYMSLSSLSGWHPWCPRLDFLGKNRRCCTCFTS
jgi:hypothetical protein